MDPDIKKHRTGMLQHLPLEVGIVDLDDGFGHGTGKEKG
jgi:hypothetical protein